MKKQINILLIIIAFIIIIGASYPIITSADNNVRISNITEFSNNGDINEALMSLLIDETETTNILKADTIVNAIIKTNGKSLMDGMKENNFESMKEYQNIQEYKDLSLEIESELKNVASKIRATGLDVEICYSYSALFCGLGIKTQYKNINLLSDLEDVTGVQICNNYMAPETAVSAEIMKVNIVRNDYGYKGEGQFIAVIDTGLDVNHDAFSAMPTNPAYDKNYISERLSNLSAYSGFSWMCYGNEYNSDYTGKSMNVDYVYQNDKVIYAYDYADKDYNVTPTELAVNFYGAYHGTHVSGIAAGNNGKDFFGMAPEAQLAMLDVFSDNTGSCEGIDIYAAMNDAVLLGADVINMSIGSTCGYFEDEYFQKAVDAADEAGVILCVSAGNSYTSAIGNTWGNYSTTENLDFGTISSPSSNCNTLSVASINAIESEIGYFMCGDRKILYADSMIKIDENTQGTQNLNAILENTGKDNIELEYVLIPGYAADEDFEGIDVNGKIAVMKRGNKVSFNEKVLNAEERGAIGAIIYNDMEEGIRIGMSLPTAKIPAVFVDNSSGLFLSEQTNKIIKLNKDYIERDTHEMSEFSSWGPVGNLVLKPEVTAPGGDIYSALHNNVYAYCSGTSMASPNAAGASALLIQRLKEKYPDMLKTDRKKLAQKLLMSTAVPAMDVEDRYYSPRKQGAGVVDIYAAIASDAYLSVDKYDNKAKAELGDDKARTGVFNVEYEIVNMGKETLSYKFETITMCEAIGVYVADYDKYLCANYDKKLNPTIEYFIKNGDTLIAINDEIEVDGNSSKKVTVKITLSDSDREYIEKYFPYGNYIEGYVRMYSECGNSDLSMVYLGFFGDWTEAPYFDNSVYEDEMPSIPYGYLTGVWNSRLGILGNYCFEHTSDMEIPEIDADKACISVYGNGYTNFYSSVIGLMRNLKNYTYRIVDKYTGEIYFDYTGYDFARKSYYVGGYGTILPDEATFQWQGESERYFYSQLPNNTECVFEFIGHLEGVNPEEENSVKGSWSVPLTIDSEKPQLISSKFYLKDGKICMDAELYDNFYLMSAFLSNASENQKGEIIRGKALQKYATPILNQNEKSEKITLTFDLSDVTEYIVNEKRFIISVFDYAMNSSEFLIEFDKLPDLGLPTTLKINNGNDLILSINEQMHLETMVGPENYGLYLDYTYAWISSNENVVKIDDNGNIIAIDSGKSVISCIASFLDDEGKLHSLIAQINIDVNDRPQYAKFNKDIINIGIGESISELPILYPYENGKFIECEYQWYSSNENIAKIIDNKIVGVSVGITELRCDVKCIINENELTFSATVKINVLPLPDVIYFNNDVYYIDKNDIMDVSIKLPENTAVQFTSIKYLSKDEAIVRIQDGKILGVNVGSAEINAICSYTENGIEKTLTATAVVNVKNSDKLRIVPNKIDIYINGVLMSKNTYDMELNSEIVVTIVTDPWYADDNARIYAFSGDRNAVKIDGNTIKATSLGTVVIYADSARKSSLYTYFTINIIEASEDTEDNSSIPDVNVLNNYSILSNSDSKNESSDFVINSENVLIEYKGNGGDVVIPDGVIAIDSKVFYQNMDIVSITLPDSLTTIGEYCFNESSIVKIVFGKGIIVIKKGAFADCFDLSEIEFVAIEGKLDIEDKAFYSTSIKQLVLPEGTETIGKSAFEWTYLTEVKLADSITVIDNQAFANTKLKTITLPAELTFIGEKAFEISSVVMDKLVIPSKVETILKDAFNKCNIKLIYIPASVINIDFAEYSPNTNAEYEIAEDNTHFYIENKCVYNEYKNLIAYLGTEKNVTIKEGTIRIAPNCFKVFGAEVVIIPASVKAIGDKALINVNTICFNGNAPILEGGDTIEGYTNFDKNAHIFINNECKGFDKLCWNKLNVMESNDENMLKIDSVSIEAIENKVTITWDCSSLINLFRIYSITNEGRKLIGEIENQKFYTFDAVKYGTYSFVVVGVIKDSGNEKIGLDSEIMNIELTSEKANELDKLLAEYFTSENKAELFKEIETKYNELNALQKAQLKNISVLNEINNNKQIEAVNELITKAIESQSEEDIANAKEAYNELNGELKTKTNYSSLVIYEMEKANQIESDNYKSQLADAEAKSDAQAKNIEQLNEKVTLFIVLFIVAACAALALAVVMIIKSRKSAK